MRVLLIDDLRDLDYVVGSYLGKDTNDLLGVVERTYDGGIAALKNGPWDVLFLDHDLGDYENGVERTGYNVVCFLEENPEFLPKKIILVTSNPVGRMKMQAVIDKLYGENS